MFYFDRFISAATLCKSDPLIENWAMAFFFNMNAKHHFLLIQILLSDNNLTLIHCFVFVFYMCFTLTSFEHFLSFLIKCLTRFYVRILALYITGILYIGSFYFLCLIKTICNFIKLKSACFDAELVNLVLPII